jgi:ATP-dependent DNA helicase RecG
LFVEEMGGFSVTFSQTRLSPERLERLGLNERQLALVEHVKSTGFITNSVVQRLTGVSKATATRDLDGLVQHDILVRRGRTGRGLRYVLKGS